jgi:hypothetical protein
LITIIDGCLYLFKMSLLNRVYNWVFKPKSWKKIVDYESDNINWEFHNNQENKTVLLHHIPSDIKLNVTYDEFAELIQFTKDLDRQFY